MLIPLGFLAASGGVAGDFVLLETQVLTGTQDSVTFSSLGTLAAGFKHLQLRIAVRSNRAVTVDNLTLSFNGVGGTSYAYHEMFGNGSTVSSAALAGRANIILPPLPGSSAAADSFAAVVIDILDPFETTKNTTTRALGGMTSTNFIVLSSGVFLNTAAISSLTIDQFSAGSFVQHSRFSLYGIRG